MSNAHDVMEHYRQRYLSSRDMARIGLSVVGAVYGMVLYGAIAGWMPMLGLLAITLIYMGFIVMMRGDRSLPPWWAYWGGTIVLLPVDTDRKRELRQWVADSGIAWYHPEDFVYHFRHKQDAVFAKLTWGGR